MSAALEFAERLRMELTAAIEQDAAAFEQVMAAYRLPKDSPEAQAAREQAIETAMLTAARVPLQVAGKAVEVLALATQVVELGNLNAISDGATGGALARAALSGAGYNVRINAASLKDSQSAQEMLAQLLSLEQQAAVHEGRLRSSLVQRGGFSLE
jgi:formiminotetrahydrofolate cyclodeaminase